MVTVLLENLRVFDPLHKPFWRGERDGGHVPLVPLSGSTTGNHQARDKSFYLCATMCLFEIM